MKALIRNDGETVRETDGIDGIDWQTGAPLTNEGWCGGPYALAQDAPADAEPCDFDITTEEIPDPNAPAEGEGTSEVPTITRRIATLNQARYEARKAQEGAEYQPEPENAPAGEDGAPAGASDQPETIIIDGVEYRPVGE